MSIEPDIKDWTWVTERTCDECAFDPATVELDGLPSLLRSNAEVWRAVLAAPGVTERPDASTWSPLEYACHVRDVNDLFDERVRLMLAQDDPEFADWDQDRTAVEDDYASQDPAAVAEQVADSAARVASTYDAVRSEHWRRTGRRSNGSVFTVDSIARYHLHDVVHHVHDVAHVTRRLTREAYDAFAADYASGTTAVPEDVMVDARALAEAVGPGGRVLEVGSGSGRDARVLEELGLVVRRTDIAPAFVRLMRDSGVEASVLDPLTDDLADPDGGGPYDGVWASASLLHARREDLPVILARLAEATRAGGRLVLSLKEGDGEVVSTHGHVAAPRHFTMWREGPLRAALDAAGWDVDHVARWPGLRETWLNVRASRR